MSTKQTLPVVSGRALVGRLSYCVLCCMLIVCTGCPRQSERKSSNTTEATNADLKTGLDEAAVSSPKQQDRVLRHAVFFSFKESATDEQVKEVVDAFRALPDKIDTIVDFQWGTNNSPEGLNDGFTHCFLLTFKDEAGRAKYLPHDAHKAFGDVLRPHMDKVFVVDYWGTPAKEKLDKTLRHMVFFKFKDDAPEERVKAVVDAFADLPSKIGTIKTFEWGTNNSPEKHSDGFTHAFMVTFASEDGRATYLPHPDHKAFGGVLKPVLDKVRVIDFWAEK